MVLVILDREEDFLYGITTYFQDKLGKSFDIYAFHTKETLLGFAREKRKKIDIYLGSSCLDDAEKREMQVEIQLRTIAMDVWASLEHQMNYKKETILTEDLSTELLECANLAHALDERMNAIHKKLSKNA